jgi:YteA family regulatory protein
MYEKMKKRLEEMKKEKQELYETLNNGNMRQSMAEYYSELSFYDNHSPDLGAETFEREKDLALLTAAEQRLEKIDNALKRIEKGTYGICEVCGKKIGMERLNAMPETTLCKECKERDEALDPVARRPGEEELTATPFYSSFHDTPLYYRSSTDEANNPKEEVGVDGEDIWQSIARWGNSNSPQDVGGALNYENIYIDSDEEQGVVEKVEKRIPGADRKGTAQD